MLDFAPSHMFIVAVVALLLFGDRLPSVMRSLGKGDEVNLLGIAAFVVVTIACYARMVPLFIQAGNRLLALCAALQVLVLLAAASGVFR